ncbi:AraC family transcriptional regulator [Cohnella sp. GCM10027633]|uniref:AraC family transcriptional regulator n=1 Tax=unclassified Cohnella TaxID=2636738 RepID=UPI0036345FB4
MRTLFDPVLLQGRPMQFEPRTRSTSGYPGYYHWHECCEALYVHEGNGFVIVDQKTYEMRPGRLFFFQPYQLHKVFANVSERTPYERTLLFFDPLFFDRALQPFRARRALFEHLWKGRLASEAIDLEAEAEFVGRLFERYGNKVRANERPLSEEDMTMLMLQLLEAMPTDGNSIGAAGSPRDIRPFSHAENAMAWIEQHYSEDFRLEDVAEALHLSKFYLSRLFQRETGSSLSDYVVARRVKQACRLLDTTPLAVERIAADVGYPNASYFIRAFKKMIGTTPHKYRNASRQAFETRE